MPVARPGGSLSALPRRSEDERSARHPAGEMQSLPKNHSEPAPTPPSIRGSTEPTDRRAAPLPEPAMRLPRPLSRWARAGMLLGLAASLLGFTLSSQAEEPKVRVIVSSKAGQRFAESKISLGPEGEATFTIDENITLPGDRRLRRFVPRVRDDLHQQPPGRPAGAGLSCPL